MSTTLFLKEINRITDCILFTIEQNCKLRLFSLATPSSIQVKPQKLLFPLHFQRWDSWATRHQVSQNLCFFFLSSLSPPVSAQILNHGFV